MFVGQNVFCYSLVGEQCFCTIEEIAGDTIYVFCRGKNGMWFEGIDKASDRLEEVTLLNGETYLNSIRIWMNEFLVMWYKNRLRGIMNDDLASYVDCVL